MSEVFKTLSEINVNQLTEKKNGLTYLSWASAWHEVCKHYPDANYEVEHFDGKPYLFDENLGYSVSTRVTIGGKTIPMSLPVMDFRNNAMRHIEYSIKTNRGETIVQPATMFDINKTMMRCLAKNLAMHGLGLYIYAGEDLPDVEPEKLSEEDQEKIKQYAEKYGYTAEQICKAYGVKSLSEFTSDMAAPVCRQIQEWAKSTQEQQ